MRLHIDRLRFNPARLMLGILVFSASSFNAVRADVQTTMPAGTQVKFHVDGPLSSNESKTGDAFTFELLEPIVLADQSISVEGTSGSGTVLLAGHAGSNGHEGDLTLRLDSLRTADGRTFAFADQRFHIDGRNRKATAGVLSLVPFAGFGARMIRGSDIRVDPTTPIQTVLLRPTYLATEPEPVTGP